MLMSIFCWVLLGLMAGLVASKVGMGRNEGMALDLALGVIGAVVGGWIFRSVGNVELNGVNIWSLFVAGSGAAMLLMARRAYGAPGSGAIDMDQWS